MDQKSLVDRLLSNSSLYAALLVAWVAMLGSLYFSEVRNFVPCTLCWYQRIFMYPLALLIGVGLLRRDRYLPYLVLPFSIVGQGISTYHYLLQKTMIFGTPTTCQAGVPCTTVYINWLGFITIPFLAMVAFMLITICMVIALYTSDLNESTPIPWQPVTVIVGVAVIVYIVLAQTAEPALAQTAAFEELPVVTGEPRFTPVEPGGADAALLVAEGAELYAQLCAGCHGPGGVGIAGLGASLADSEFIATHDDAEVLAMIRAGRMPGDPDNTTGMVMPPSGGRPDLSDEELLAIIAYLRNQ